MDGAYAAERPTFYKVPWPAIGGMSLIFGLYINSSLTAIGLYSLELASHTKLVNHHIQYVFCHFLVLHGFFKIYSTSAI